MNSRVYVGPMFSSKTNNLLLQLKVYPHIQFLIVKYSGDNRYTAEPQLATHDGKILAKNGTNWRTISADCIQTVLEHYDGKGIIIDELHLYKDLDTAFPLLHQKVVDNDGLLICSSLLLPKITSLLPLFDRIMHLYAFCGRCKKALAYHTCKHTQSEKIIGGPELYISVCRPCYKQHYAGLPYY